MSLGGVSPGGVFALAGAPLWIAAGLALLAWIGAALLERRRADSPRRRALRLVLLAIACDSLFLLAAQPLRWRRVEGGEGMLLTSGASTRDLAAATGAGLPAWAVPASAGEPPTPAGADELPDAATLARQHPELSRLRIAGHGLAPWELAEVPAAIAAETPPPLPFGVARIAWPRRILLGESVEVGGLAAGIPSSGATVRVTGPAVGEASARLGGGSSPFRLRVEPRGPGHHLLELRLEAHGQPAVVETLDVEVVAATPPAVLWLDAAPSAEAREVKRWLASSGGAFAWRAQVSRGIARDDSVGTAPLPRGPLGAAQLARFDLVVADARALAGLGAAERAALAAAVRDGGAGLLLRAGDSASPAALGVSFPVRSLPGGGEMTARVDWDDSESAPLPLPARELVPAALQVPLLADRAGRTLGAWRPLGKGAVGVSLVDDTWRWVLAGRADDHRRYWRGVVAALARRAEPQPRWDVAPGPVLVGAPITITLDGSSTPPPAATLHAPSGEVTSIPLRQDEDEPTRWSTTFWPREPGWHSVGEGAAATSIWIAPADHWTTWRLAARQEATAARAAAPPAAAREPAAVRRRMPVPRWPLFLLLLVSLALLWA
ncbi:MAG TPA: hypothetical protein VN923_15850, partial [Thermoanaerobaculia bacterium]|nr:hypothetical protein [Thermoanaerobaculia bacterium]